MKNTKTKFILLTIAILSIVGITKIADAASSSLYVSPATLTKAVGNVFSTTVGVKAAGNKVCAAEGTLVFNNLTCQSISVASGLMAQSTPTCADPYFMVGIPSCTTLDKTLFTVSVKAGKAGAATLGSTSIDIIGEGLSLGSASASGKYTITAAAPVPTPVPVVKPTPKGGTTTVPEPTPVKEVQLFDITMTLENPIIAKSSDLVARTNFVSFGNVPTPVSLIYRIEDSKGDVIYTEKGEVTVETEKLETKTFTNFNVGNGNYNLVLSTTYGNNIKTDFKQSFEVKEVVPVTAPETKSTSYIWIIAILVLGVGAYYFYQSKRMKNIDLNIVK
jgi:hypothetical protein